MQSKEWVTCPNKNCGKPKHIDRSCACEVEEIEEDEN